MLSVATAKAALVTTYGLTSWPKQAEPPKVVLRPSFRQAQVEEVSRSRTRPSCGLAPEEGALWEAAIQLDLVAVNTAEAQVARGGTVAAWMARQGHLAGDRKAHPHKALDKVLLLALVVFNLLALIASGAAIDWVLGHLI